MTIDDLKSSGAIPRLHGNAFIQVDLSKNKRLHIWHPELKKLAQTTRTPIHDHMFDFSSEVVLGRLLHHTYELKEHAHGLYNVYQAVPGENEETELVKEEKRVDIITTGIYNLPVGSTYFFSYAQYHESDSFSLTATVIEKGTRYPGNPRVLCLVGEEPDNDFKRNNVGTVLWDYIEEVLKQVK